MTTRRGFLAGLLAAAAAPAIARTSALMPIKADPWAGWPVDGEWTVESWIRPPVGVWQHHAVTRQGGVLQGYINGVVVTNYAKYAPNEAGVLLPLTAMLRGERPRLHMPDLITHIGELKLTRMSA